MPAPTRRRSTVRSRRSDYPVETVCEFEIDETELRESATDCNQYYAELADRLQAVQDEAQPLPQDYPEDRMVT